jgi:flagellar basal-body rod modification protein FlgD
MTTINSTSAAGSAGATAPAKTGFNALGHGDFLRLMVEQLKQQDPFEPVDNKDMLAQMAQFSALAGSTEGNATLQAISDKLDALIEAQKAASAAAGSPQS